MTQDSISTGASHEAVLTNLPLSTAVPVIAAQIAVEAHESVLSNLTAQAKPDDPQKAAFDEQLRLTGEALDRYRESPWLLGDQIGKLRSIYKAWMNADIDDGAIGFFLKNKITRQRVGQIANTCAYFGPEFRDTTVGFRVYEAARIDNDKRKAPLPVAELFALIREARDVELVKKALQENTHVFDVRVIVTETPDGWHPKIDLAWDKKPSVNSPTGNWPDEALMALVKHLQETREWWSKPTTSPKAEEPIF